MSDCDDYCTNYGCNQGRDCPAHKGGICHCAENQNYPGTEFTAFERFVVLILFVLVLYFAASVVLRWGLI